MLHTFKNGQTSVLLKAKLLDSTATNGNGLTGLTNASSGLIISTIADNEATATAYTVAGSTIETIATLGTYAAPTATKCRFKEVDATNNKGIYEFQFADARFAVSNAKSLLVSVSGATNLAQMDFVIQLQSDDPYVAKPTNSNLLSVDANGRVDVIKVAGTTQTAGDIIASIEAVGTAGGAAINIDAAGDNEAGGISGVTSGTTKVGAQTGTYPNASFENLIYHVITHSGNAIDRVYQYLPGGGTTPVGVRWIGYLTSANDTVTASAWNHVGGAWEAIGTISGSAGTSNSTYNFTLYSRHAGTSVAELGKVYIRLHCTAMTSPVLNTDQLVVSYAISSRTAGYANGAVWLDTIGGVAGTESFVNGTADNPASTFANALTIAAAVNLHKFEIANGSSITLTASAANYTFNGHEWNLALGGQNISSMMTVDATVTGTGTGTLPEFDACTIGTVTLPPCLFWDCIFTSTVTVGSAGDYFFIDCSSGVAGTATPVLDMAGVGSTNLSLRRWSGGLTINNLAAGDIVSIDVVSGGTITLNGADATVAIRGMCNVVNNLTGSPTVTTSSVINQTVLATPTNITAGTIATVTNIVTADIRKVNNLTIDGTGTALDPWGPV